MIQYRNTKEDFWNTLDQRFYYMSLLWLRHGAVPQQGISKHID